MTFWNRMANQKNLRLPISFAVVEIAARQGESNRLNSRKEMADRLVGKKAANWACMSGAYSSISPRPLSTPMVETMPSLATKPLREEATACQVPKPRGAKIQAMAPPMVARKQ